MFFILILVVVGSVVCVYVMVDGEYCDGLDGLLFGCVGDECVEIEVVVVVGVGCGRFFVWIVDCCVFEVDFDD